MIENIQICIRNIKIGILFRVNITFVRNLKAVLYVRDGLCTFKIFAYQKFFRNFRPPILIVSEELVIKRSFQLLIDNLIFS